MILKAHAKINLSLDVLNKREDGYHNLSTIMIPLEMHDSIEIYIIRSGMDDYVTCDDFSLSISKYNLCHQMINAARNKWGFKEHFNVSIHKNIFLQAGLGGGSSDAGATLLGIIALLKIKCPFEEIIELALSIGSDVPWALLNKPCVVKRRGNILEPFDLKNKYFVLLVKPLQGLSTQTVFNYADTVGIDTHGDINKVKDYLINGDQKELGETIFNSLQEAAIKLLPEIQNIISLLKNDGFKVVLMSGAGSCVFALSEDLEKAKKAEKKYTQLGYCVELTRFL